jgi:hypothetical protein
MIEDFNKRSGTSTILNASLPGTNPINGNDYTIPTTEPAEDLTVLSVVRWRNGRREVERLATCHPHGYWMHWEHGGT